MKSFVELETAARNMGINIIDYDWRRIEHSRWKHRRNEKESDIYCPFCGFCCRSLGNHLKVHGLTKQQFKPLFGLRKKGRMTCFATHIRQSNATSKLVELGILKGRQKTKADGLGGNFPENSMTYVKQLNSKYRDEIQRLRDKKLPIETVKEILTDYSRWMETTGYLDSDWWSEEPQAIDRFLQEKYPPESTH